jgi:hypothetical protein
MVKKVGFSIIRSDLSPVEFQFDRIESINDRYILYNSSTPLMSCFKTLLPTSYRSPIGLPNFKVFGLYIHDIIKLGAMDPNFTVTTKDPDDIINSIHDLNVVKPDISMITKKKLNLPDDWDIRHIDIPELEDVMIKESEDDLIQSFMESFDEKRVDLSIFDDPMEMFLDQNFLESGVNVLSQIQDLNKQVYLGTMIFNRVKGLKYLMITSLVTDISYLSSKTISCLSHMIMNYSIKRNITYSLIYSYDRAFESADVVTPDSIIIRLNPRFDELFGVMLPSIDI